MCTATLVHWYTMRKQSGCAEHGTSGQAMEEDGASVYGYTGTQ